MHHPTHQEVQIFADFTSKIFKEEVVNGANGDYLEGLRRAVVLLSDVLDDRTIGRYLELETGNGIHGN